MLLDYEHVLTHMGRDSLEPKMLKMLKTIKLLTSAAIADKESYHHDGARRVRENFSGSPRSCHAQSD